MHSVTWRFKTHHLEVTSSLWMAQANLYPVSVTYYEALMCSRNITLWYYLLSGKSPFFLNIKWVLYNANGLGRPSLFKLLLIIHSFMCRWPVWKEYMWLEVGWVSIRAYLLYVRPRGWAWWNILWLPVAASEDNDHNQDNGNDESNTYYGNDHPDIALNAPSASWRIHYPWSSSGDWRCWANYLHIVSKSDTWCCNRISDLPTLEYFLQW